MVYFSQTSEERRTIKCLYIFLIGFRRTVIKGPMSTCSGKHKIITVQNSWMPDRCKLEEIKADASVICAISVDEVDLAAAVITTIIIIGNGFAI